MRKALNLFLVNYLRGLLDFLGVFVIFVDFKQLFYHIVKCLHIITIDELSWLIMILLGMSGGFQLAELENDLREFIVLHDLGQDEWFDFAHFVSTVFIAEYFVDSSEGPSEGGVEMIFNGIVCPMLWFKKYLPGKSLLISFQRFPDLACA